MRRPAVFLCCCLIVVAGLSGSRAAETKRVAYIEAGPFWIFRNSLEAFKKEMARDARYRVEYPPELHVSPGWDKSPGDLEREARRLQEREDIDLIIGAGTAAVRALLGTNSGKTPILGIDLSDPLTSGLVSGPDDSGADNFTCDVVIDRWKQMFRVFHEVIGFSTLGLLHSPGEAGMIAGAVADARAVAAEMGFRVLAREIPGEAADDCLAGLEWLRKNGAEAFFIGPLNCFDWEQSDPEILYRRLNDEYKMPTFARDGSYQVQGGALLGFTTWNFARTAARNVRKAAAIFGGASPRSLPMRVAATPLMVVNIQTALRLEVDLPFELLVSADEVFTETRKPVLPK